MNNLEKILIGVAAALSSSEINEVKVFIEDNFPKLCNEINDLRNKVALLEAEHFTLQEDLDFYRGK